MPKKAVPDPACPHRSWRGRGSGSYSTLAMRTVTPNALKIIFSLQFLPFVLNIPSFSLEMRPWNILISSFCSKRDPSLLPLVNYEKEAPECQQERFEGEKAKPLGGWMPAILAGWGWGDTGRVGERRQEREAERGFHGYFLGVGMRCLGADFE